MIYKTHGIADLNFDKLYQVLDQSEPTWRSEWTEYWNRDSDRDSKELQTKTQYSEQSSSYWQYTDSEIDKIIPQKILDHFNLDRETTEIKVFRYPPGSFTPPHVDRFNSLKSKYKLSNAEKIIRVWIALDNPRFGHALFFENDVVHDVPRGTMLTWNHGARHSACNAGDQDRYIMTITGVVNS